MLLLRGPMKFLSLLAVVALLAGCGFRLAGTAELPASLSIINLTTSGFDTEQRQQLERRLQQAGARISTETSAPTLSVTLARLSDNLLFETGDNQQTRRLVQQLTYRIRSADNSLLQAERRLRQESDLEIDLLNIVANDRERSELQQQMLDQLVSRMIYQLQRM